MKIKSVFAALIAFSLFVSSAGVSLGQETRSVFKDIRGSFAEEPINRLTKQGIIQGISSDQFAPGKNVTRLQFAIIIAKSLGVQPFYPARPTFSDLPVGSIHTGYVEALANLGLIKGIKATALTDQAL